MNGRLTTIALALAGIAQAQSVEDTAARIQARTATRLADSAIKVNAEQDEKIQAVDGRIDGLNESYLDTKATVDALKKLKVSGFVQFQYALTSDTTANATSNTYTAGAASTQKQGAWSLRRARVKIAYNAGNGAEFAWQPNFIESKFETKDAYFQYTEQWLKSIWVRGGIQDIPFGFEIGNSSSGMELIERSRYENNGLFNGEKALGLVVGYTSSDFPWVNLKAGWLNGQTETAVTNDWSATQDPKNFSGRLGTSLTFNDLGLSVDAGVSSFLDEKFLTDTTAGGTYKTMGSDSAGPKYVGVTKSYRTNLYTNLTGVDLEATYEIPMLGGFKLLGEYYTGREVGASGKLTPYLGGALQSADVRNIQAFYIAGILNPVAYVPQLQLVYRFDYYDPNSDVKGDQIDATRGFSATDIAYTTNTVGLNWFVNGNFKVSLFYDIVNNETTSAPSLDGWTGDAKRTVAQGATKTGYYIARNDYSKNIPDNVLTLRGQVAF